MTTPPPPQGQNPFAQGQNPYAQQPPGPAPQGGYGYPQQGQPGFPPPQGQPGFPQQGQPGFPPQGQPGFPPQSPYMNQGGPTAPMPQQRPKRGIKSYIRIGGAVLVVIIAIGGWYASRDDADTASVGDCMHAGNPNDASNPDLEVVDCSSPKAEYKVALKKDDSSGCDTTKYSSYTESGDGKPFTLCLTDYKP